MEGETQKKTRLLNYRPMCVVAVSLIGGIIMGEFFYGVNPLFRLIPFFLLIAFFAVFMLLKRFRRFSYIFVMIMVGFLGLVGTSDIYAKNISIGKYEGYIYGVVSSDVSVEKGHTYFYIEDVEAGDKKLKYEAHIVIDFEDNCDCKEGDYIRVYGVLESLEHQKFESFNYYDVEKREAYTVFSDSGIEKLAEGKLHVFERIPYRIKSYFYERMDVDSAAICTALVLGDKSGLDEVWQDNISVSGFAHILAVSGLHISVISAVLFYLLRKMKVSPKIALLVVFGLMLFYCFLCDFTASSLRALIMMTVLHFSVAFGRKRDTLSTIAFSAIIILIIRPTALIEPGFLISYAAVFGIGLFYSKFNSVGLKIAKKISPNKNIGRIFSAAVSLSLSANLVMFPFIAYFYRRITTLFMLSNILVLPYLMLIYAFLLVIVVISLIIGWSGMLVIFDYLLVPFKFYVNVFGSAKFVTIPVQMTPIGVLGLLILFVFLSKYIFTKRLTKVAVGSIIASITIALSVISTYADNAKKSESSKTKTQEIIQGNHVSINTDFIELSSSKEYDYINSIVGVNSKLKN